MSKQLNLCCIASGSGTDFEAIAQAWKNGWLPEINEVFLISTKKDAGCLKKARKLKIKTKVIKADVHNMLTDDLLSKSYKSFGGIDLVFLVGCLKKAAVVVPTYNIHPADPFKHGGQGMYGLKVHIHVLDSILDQIIRGIKSLESARFFTYPTVHEVISEYDKGKPLLQASVEIPNLLVYNLLCKRCHIKDAAKQLQQIVLFYEHLLLPAAVRMAAKKIIDR